MSERELAVAQIKEARSYVSAILETIPEADWLRFPTGCESNIAWQVAHLAMANYRLGLERVRSVQPADESLIPKAFIEIYQKGTVPNPSADKNFPIPEIKRIFAAVYDQLLKEEGGWTDEFLHGETATPHRLFTKKIDALWWCGRHEMLHAGQIGLIRRMLGQKPIW